jgi:hypothetical protein
VELFKPVMHLIMLVWRHSKHYNSPARLVTLIRELCNDLIMQVRCWRCWGCWRCCCGPAAGAAAVVLLLALLALLRLLAAPPLPPLPTAAHSHPPPKPAAARILCCPGWPEGGRS